MPYVKKTNKVLSDEHRAKIAEGMRKAREAKLAAQTSNLNEKVEEGKHMAKPTEQKAIPDAISVLLGSISEQVTKQIDETVTGEFAELRKLHKQNAKLNVTFNGKTNEIKGLRHTQLDELIKLCAMRLPVLLVGVAGTGKTHASEQVAEALGLQYFTMSVGAQTSKSDIMGYMNANGNYVATMFRQSYEHGGVFLMDEIDAGNANVLIQVNAALSNGVCAFPDVMVKKHKDFVFIASANTYGTGMNRQYVGRNQLDAATLDRFTILDWVIDNNLEEQLATGPKGKDWLETVRTVRVYIEKHNIRALVTPRATQKGSALLHNGFDVKDVIPMVLLGSVPDDKKQDVIKLALGAFEKEQSSQKK